MKKEKPSIANPRPNMTPAANRAAITFVQRFANVR
jgi:hypothetical protein